MVEALHELDPNFLTGQWQGAGTVLVHGKVIPYDETTEFKLLRMEPVIVYNYQQFTKHAESGKPMHAENGFWKIFPPGPDGLRKVEASFSHPFSLNEFEVGHVGKHSETGAVFVEMAATEPHHF